MLTVENLEKDLKQGNLNSIYLLYGEETFLLESCLKKIKNNFGERKEGINEIKLDDTNVNSIISDMETPAFGYEKKIIIVRNSGLFKKEGKRKTGVNTKLIENVARYINENIEIKKGIYIAQISLDSPVSKTGLKIGDIITKIDNLELTKMSDLRRYIYTKKPGEEVTLTILRNNKEQQIKIKLSKK